MVQVEGIHAINWNAPDPRAAERFYTEVLGGKVTVRHQVRGVDVVRVRVGNTGIGIFDASGGPASGVPHHTFRMGWVADQQEATAALERAGARVSSSRLHGEGPGYSLYVTDPIGNYLELSYDPPA
jgi:predicted enzyme related to lactoylglutathione lyase